MHRTAEYGIAAHWKYKLGKGGKDLFDDKLRWIRQIIENGNEYHSAGELIADVKGDLSTEEVFVFTPRGDIKNLPLGSTVKWSALRWTAESFRLITLSKRARGLRF
jgi:GTP pyrophosphokinase